MRHLRHRNTAPLICGTGASVSVFHPSSNVAAALRDDDGTPLAGPWAELAPELPKGKNHE